MSDFSLKTPVVELIIYYVGSAREHYGTIAAPMGYDFKSKYLLYSALLNLILWWY